MTIKSSSIKTNFKITMKIFRTIQKRFAIVGIGHNIAHKRIFFGFSIFACATISQVMYIFRTANDFMAYIEGVCWISGSFIVSVCFTTILFKRKILFESIHSYEKFLDTSEPISYSYILMNNSYPIQLQKSNFRT